jgi:hypothetical protein
MSTPQWIKNLSGHAGALYLAAELAKRGIPTALLPEGFADDDVFGGRKDGSAVFFAQVKSCHPDRSDTFRLSSDHEAWATSQSTSFVVFVWLGSPKKNSAPRFWLASRVEVGRKCVEVGDTLRRNGHGDNTERRLRIDRDPNQPGDNTFVLPLEWENRWSLFDAYLPSSS